MARREGEGAEAPNWKRSRKDSSRLYAAPEIEELQRVILHRPRLELRRLTHAGKK